MHPMVRLMIEVQMIMQQNQLLNLSQQMTNQLAKYHDDSKEYLREQYLKLVVDGLVSSNQLQIRGRTSWNSIIETSEDQHQTDIWRLISDDMKTVVYTHAYL